MDRRPLRRLKGLALVQHAGSKEPSTLRLQAATLLIALKLNYDSVKGVVACFMGPAQRLYTATPLIAIKLNRCA